MQALVDLADKWLNLYRLELDVYTDNEPAIKLYKEFGFQIEGTRVGEAFRDGKFVGYVRDGAVAIPQGMSSLR